MPTPSSNQPSDQSSTPPYAFSTCPDDQPHPARPTWLTHDTAQPGTLATMDVSESPPATVDSPATFSSHPSRDGPASDDSTILGGGLTSVGPSSRATTVSPRPPSRGTLAPPPQPSGQDDDDLKAGHDVEPSDGLGRQSSAAPGHLQQVENADAVPREVDSIDWLVEEEECSSLFMGNDYPNRRTIAISPSSYLRPGSRFHGSQQSERQVYEVQVEIKHVDMRESFLCGYLRIQGLTEDHPTLTTYFEGEIIGSKYGFFTKHDDWGANAKVDLNHWSKFGAFRPFQKSARKGAVAIHDVAQRENIFMRWKEHFLVPDHRVRTIIGASFEGFYYICFNQIKGEISGIYFHSKSEKFQQLELKHVPDRGCFHAMEFR